MNVLLKIKDYYFDNKNKCNMYFLLFFSVVVFSLFSIFYIKYDKKKQISDSNNNISNNIEISSLNDNSSKIFVDLKGYVEKEGVYELSNGSRVIDVINLSGGFKEGANTRFINLSKVLEDGDVIVIYSNEEIKEAEKSNIIYVETPCICEKVNNDACIDQNVPNQDDVINDPSTDSISNLININTATKEELISLNGIGEAKAKAIIDYRDTNGKFNSIEDLLEVSGISEAIFDNIKENITV